MMSHFGTKETARLVVQHFVWQGVQKDSRTWEQAYQFGQPSTVSRHAVTPVGDFTLPVARFLHVLHRSREDSSLQLTSSRAGQKPYPSWTAQPTPWHAPS
jgi:hypothetical protein